MRSDIAIAEMKRVAMDVRTVIAEDDPDLAEMLATAIEGETDVLEAMDRLFFAEKEAASDAAALKAKAESLVGDLAARRSRLENRASRFKGMRESIYRAYSEETGERKLERPAYTMSPRNIAPKPFVKDADIIPREYLGKPSLTAIRAAVKAGETIPGVELDNGGESITTRVR